MLELIIVIVLLYISYKLYLQDALMQEQNEFILSLQEKQEKCLERIARLEEMNGIFSTEKKELLSGSVDDDQSQIRNDVEEDQKEFKRSKQ